LQIFFCSSGGCFFFKKLNYLKYIYIKNHNGFAQKLQSFCVSFVILLLYLFFCILSKMGFCKNTKVSIFPSFASFVGFSGVYFILFHFFNKF
jgi:hypothetical protein